MKRDTLQERSDAINLKGYPSWYRPKLEEAIRALGTKWPLHPANALDFRHKRAA